MLCESEFSDLFFLKKCRSSFENGESFRDAWKQSIAQCRLQSCLTREDILSLQAFSDVFGVSDKDGQLANCDLYIESFKQRRAEAHEKSKNAMRLYTSLGALMGVFAVILFL